MLLQLIHATLVPSSKVIEGKRVKYSIRDSQQAFTLLVSQSNEVDSFLNQKRKACVQSKTNMQPLILGVGQPFQYSHFYVAVDDEKFKFESYLEALKYCFKLMFVLNLKYPNECLAVWIFIQKFFFLIYNSYEKFPIVETLISDMKNCIAKYN